MTPVQVKSFRRRELQILAEGLAIEICVDLGDVEGAHLHRREMEAFIQARNVAMQQLEEEGGDYLLISASVSRMQAEARGEARGQ